MERSRCVSLGTHSGVKTCDTGDPESRIQIDLAGDSHAIQWFNPLKQIASEKHWHLRTYLKSGCPITDIPLRGDSIDYARSCVSWRRAAIQQIVKDQPSLIVIGNATNYLFSKSADQAPTMTFAEWQSGFSSTLQSLRPSGATILLLRDSPTPPFDVPSCLGRAAKTTWFRVNCAFPARPALHEAAFASERDSASNLSNVKVLDLSSYFCDRDHCWPDRNGVVIYRDDDHITGTYAGELADPLANILQSAIQHANSGNSSNLRAQTGVLSRAPSE